MPFEDFYDIYKSQNGVCALSDKRFDLYRIDSTRGYSKDNVFFTTFGVNRARQDLSLDDFVQMCKMVVSHSSHATTNPIPSPDRHRLDRTGVRQAPSATVVVETPIVRVV